MFDFAIQFIYNSWYDNLGVKAMAASEAQKRATAKWQKEKVEEVKFRVPKGERAVIQAHAEKQGESTAAFIKRAIKETMERDNAVE